MNIIETTFEKLPTKCLLIGFEGENLRATVRIDCSSVFAEYPNATPTLIVKPLFADAYPVVVDRNGTDVDWLITSEILSFFGDGEIQLVFYKDQVICKSAVSKIRVSRSLTVTGDMPDPVVQWIENANRKLAEVDAQIVELEGMVDTATDAATRAEQSEDNATTAAANAATSAATASTKAAEAQASADTATAKAAEAALSATQAINSAVSAADSERGAIAKAAEAAQSAQTAAQKAEQITEAAQIATGKAEEASASATSAQTSATNAASSATAAQVAQTAAEASKTAAGASATQAATSAQTANTAAQTAMQKAAEASQSASNAATSATNAATSAETASTKAGEAAQSAQAVEETAEQLAESLEQISQNTADIAEHEQYAEATYATKTDLYKKADIIHNTASGAIASFSDGAEMPVDEVTAQINPVQDLHGYDSPWPAGGGVNLLPFEDVFENGWTTTIDDLTATYNNGYMKVTGTNTTSGFINIVPYRDAWLNNRIVLGAGSYSIPDYFTLTASIDGGKDENLNNTITAVTSLSVRGFYIAVRGGETVDYNIPMMFVRGTTRPTSYSPYSNICPISGFTKAKIWDDPKYGGTIKWNQLLSENQAIGSYSKFGLTFAMISGKMGFNVTGTFNFESGDRNAYIYRQNYPIAIIKDHVYCIAYDSKYATVYCYGAQFSGNWAGYAPHGGSIIKATNSANLNLSLNFGSNISNGTVFNEEILINLFDLTEMFGEEKADEIYALDMQSPRGQGVTWFKALFPNNYYEPDNSYTETCVSAVNGDPYRQIEVEFPSEAGTVYGGSLSIAEDGSGVLTVDRGYLLLNTADMNNNEDYPAWRQSGIRSLIGGGLNTGIPDAITNISPMISGSLWAIGANTNGSGDTLILNRQYFNKSQTEWKALAMNVQFVIPLATPITYTLTASEITTLLGENNLWHDANGDISVGYKADTKLYIDNKIAELVARIVNS